MPSDDHPDTALIIENETSKWAVGNTRYDDSTGISNADSMMRGGRRRNNRSNISADKSGDNSMFLGHKTTPNEMETEPDSDSDGTIALDAYEERDDLTKASRDIGITDQ